MTIQELTAVVPPPSKPKRAGTERAARKFEAKIGIALPQDYWDLIHTYGSGTFYGRTLRIPSPFETWYDDYLKGEKEWQSDFADDFPFNLRFCEEGSLFPWGGDDNGCRMFWKIKGPPAKWPTVLFAPRSSAASHQIIRLPVTTFLAKCLTNRYRPKFWFGRFKKEELDFRPY